MDNKTIPITFRVSGPEAERIDAERLQKGITRSQWVRGNLFSSGCGHERSSPAALRSALAKFGQNVGQLANICRAHPLDRTLDRATRSVEDMLAELNSRCEEVINAQTPARREFFFDNPARTRHLLIGTLIEAAQVLPEDGRELIRFPMLAATNGATVWVKAYRVIPVKYLVKGQRVKIICSVCAEPNELDADMIWLLPEY